MEKIKEVSMPKVEKTFTLNITPKQFLNNCSPNELRELEVLLKSKFYQDRKNNNHQCRVCGCSDYNCTKCTKITGEVCSWIESDLCSRCDAEIKKLQILYGKNLYEADISSRLLRKLREFFAEYDELEMNELKIGSLENFDFSTFRMIRGNGKVVRDELINFCKENKIPVQKDKFENPY